MWEMSKKIGEKIVIPIISKHAGRKHINIAGRPIFFKLFISRDNPDLVNIIIKAICLRLDDMSNKEELIIFNTLLSFY